MRRFGGGWRSIVSAACQAAVLLVVADAAVAQQHNRVVSPERIDCADAQGHYIQADKFAVVWYGEFAAQGSAAAGRLVVVVKPRDERLPKKFYPLGAGPFNRLVVQCDSDVPLQFSEAAFVRASMAVGDLLDVLNNYATNHVVSAEQNPSTSWQFAPLSLIEDGQIVFKPWPGVRAIDALINQYLLDAPIPSQRAIRAEITVGQIRLPWYIAAGAAPGQVQAPPAPISVRTQTQIQPQAPPPPFAGQTAQAPPVNPAPVVRHREFSVSFKGQAWKSVDLTALNAIETFGHCDTYVSRRFDGLGYSLRCTVGADERLLVRIRGFKPVIIGANERALDDRLEVVGFEAAYPAEWQRPPTEIVAIGGGKLDEVLRRPIALSQNIADLPQCSAIYNLKIADILAQRIENFPGVPCQYYTLSFREGLTDQSAQVDTLCYPGTLMPVAIRNGRVTCYLKSGQAPPRELSVHLHAGFRPVLLPIPDAQDKTWGFAELAASLLPDWPYANPMFNASDAPKYTVSGFQYLDAQGRPCGQLIYDRPPTLAEARCDHIPTTLVITFQQVASPQPQNGPPPPAFIDKFQDAVAIAGIDGRRMIATDSLKRKLPVAFSREDAADYDNRFGAGVHNNAAGVSIFQGATCGSAAERKGFAPFRERTAEFTWPLSGMVFDDNRQPLTACAQATIEPSSDAPHFTFKLEPIHANRPRRVIVISTSDAFMQGNMRAALREALNRFVDLAHQAHDAQGAGQAPPSPVNIYLVNAENNYVPLLTGEMAALEPDKAKKNIVELREDIAPLTPEFGAIRYRDELKDNLERVMFVMEGSEVSDGNLNALSGLVVRLSKNNVQAVTLYLTSDSCARWTKDVPVVCKQLPPTQDGRQDMLTKAFTDFITGANGVSP